MEITDSKLCKHISSQEHLGLTH